MSDQIIAWIRTVVPALLGLGWAKLTPILDLLADVGINVDTAAVEVVVVAAVIGVWYAIARKLEQYRWFTWINGHISRPTY